MTTTIKVCIEYEFGIDLDANSEEEFNNEFIKLRNIVKKDAERFILSNIDNSNVNRNIYFEIKE